MQKSKRIFAVLAGLATLSIAAIGISYMVLKKRGSTDDLMLQVPANSLAFVVASDLQSVVLDYEIDTTKDVQSNLQSLGLQLSLTQLLQKAKLNPLGKVGLAIVPQADSNCMVGYLPSRDSQATAAFIAKTLPTLHLPEAHKAIHQEQRQQSLIFSNQNTAWMGKDNWLLLAHCAEDGTASQSILQQLHSPDFTPAIQADWYTSIQAIQDKAWNFFIAVNPDIAPQLRQTLMEKTSDDYRSKLDQFIDNAQGFALALHLTADTLQAHIHLAVKQPSDSWNKLSHVETQDKLLAKLPGEALLTMRIPLHAEYSFMQALQGDPEVKDRLTKIVGAAKLLLGINVKKDVLPYLGSPISAAVLADDITAPPFIGGAIWLPLKSGHKLDQLLLQLSNRLKTKLPITHKTAHDSTWFEFQMQGMNAQWTIIEDHLLVTAGRNVPNQIQRDFAQSSLLNKLPTASQKSLSSSSTGALAIDFKPIQKRAHQLPNLPPQSIEVLRNLSHLHTTTQLSSSSLQVSVQLDAANKKGFAAMLKEKLLAPPLQQ